MRVGGRGGRQGNKYQIIDKCRTFKRLDKIVIGSLAVEKHVFDVRVLFEKLFKVVRNGVADIRIKAAVAGTGRNHVPQCDMVRQQQIQFIVIQTERIRRVKQLCHNPPKRILRVGVVLRLLKRPNPRHRTQNQLCASRIDGRCKTFGHLQSLFVVDRDVIQRRLKSLYGV